MNDSPIDRIEWIKHIYPSFEFNDWNNDVIYFPHDLKYKDFFYLDRIYKGEIDPSQIIGIDYFEYESCSNWTDLLYSLKRLNEVIKKQKTLEAVISHIKTDQDEKCVYKYGNHFFTFSGQHRLCLAKFIDMKSVSVQIHEYKLDKEKVVKYRELRDFCKELERIGVSSGYTYDNILSWTQHDSFYFFINNFNIGMKQNLLKKFIHYNKLNQLGWIEQIKCFLWKSSFSKELGYNIEIKTIADFSKLHYLLRTRIH